MTEILTYCPIVIFPCAHTFIAIVRNFILAIINYKLIACFHELCESILLVSSVWNLNNVIPYFMLLN